MINLNIEQNNEVLKNTSDSIIEFLYNLSKGLDNNVPQYMKGRLEIIHGYADAINFLTSKFQDLYINSSQGAYIRFKDSTVQSKLATAYGDGIGLTTQQAASITASNSMYNLFRGNKTITSFDELAYFINLRTLGADSFRGCANLESIDLCNVDTINRYTFDGCNKLTTIKNYQHVTSYEYAVFQNCDLTGDYDFSHVNTSNENLENRLLGFYNNKHITSIIMPQVQYLCTFSNCQLLRTLTGLESVINIPNECFANCYELQNLYMPNLEVMSYRVFDQCNSMTLIDLPKLKQCDYNAFTNNANLIEVNVPMLDTINNSIFAGNTKLETVTIGPITKIPLNTFYNCSKLTTINMDFSLITEIEGQAFRNCSSLTSLSFPNVTKLNGSSIFTSCTSLTSISLPKLQTITGDYQESIFNGCSNLESISLPLLEDLNANKTTFLFANCSKLKTVSLPNITVLPVYIFNNCNQLETINIDWSAITFLGSYAFNNCSAFTNNDEPIVFSSLTSLTCEGPFANCAIKSLKFPALESFTTRISNQYIKNVELNLGLTVLPNYAFFACRSLESVSKLGNVTTIGTECFRYNEGLTSLDFSSNLKTINNYAFDDLKSIEYVSTETIYPTYIGYCAFYNCISLKGRIDLSLCTNLGTYAFQNCSSLTSIGSLNSTLTEIPESCFLGCTGLTGNIDIPESVTILGRDCFYGCTSLTSITFYSLTPPTYGAASLIGASYIIYVPASAVDTYKVAWPWNEITSRIQAKP